MPGGYTSYLLSLARQLRLDPREAREILQEVQAHLEDRAAEFRAQGMGSEEASALAMRQMGDPKSVARSMYAVHSPGLWRDAALAIVPHVTLAFLFALHLWSHYVLVGLVLVGATLVSWRNWRSGHPSKWSYSWMGYTLAAPILSLLLAVVTLGYGGWTFLTTGHLPFNWLLFVLLAAYVPFTMWILFVLIRKTGQP